MFFAEEKIEREKELLVTFSPHINVLSYIEQRKREKRTSSHAELSHQCYLNTEQEKEKKVLVTFSCRINVLSYIEQGKKEKRTSCHPVLSHHCSFASLDI